MTGLVVTFFLGLTFLLGMVAVRLASSKEELVEHLSLSMAFGAMVAIAFFDLIPEILEETIGYGSFLAALCVVVGIVMLKLLDHFIPEHEGDELTEQGNLVHIGVMSAIAIVLHNIVEGMTVYSVASLSLKSGISLAVGVGLHNIPMGMFIYSTIEHEGKSRKILILGLSVLSTFVGGVLMALVGPLLGDSFVPYLTSIALGMVIYILVFELLPNVISAKNLKLGIPGSLLGFLLVLLSMLFE